MQTEIPNASIFMTAVNPKSISKLPDMKSKAKFIEDKVEKILKKRKKDDDDKIVKRKKTAVNEILTAISPDGNKLYNEILHSAPEGPDGKDDWTKQTKPGGRAKKALDEFVAFIKLIDNK